MTDKDDAYWREKLTADEYHVLRQKGTERAFTGEYWDTTDAGTYKCRGCGEVLFQSESKFDAGCGWPSFDRPVAEAAIAEERDTSYGMVRTEVLCHNLCRAPRQLPPRLLDDRSSANHNRHRTYFLTERAPHHSPGTCTCLHRWYPSTHP